MKIELDIPDFEPDKGLQSTWENGFVIDTKVKSDVIIIKANSAGLKSLAIQLLTLAQEGVPSGNHFHFDDLNSLEDGSIELIIEKTE